jgi:glycosyltransferase involved in cell wall biosynthesis
MEALVSIVTVSLHSAATIRDTLDSVARQIAPFRIEHICVDGGSTDGTREIILQAASRSSQIKTLFEPDRGLYDAMNKGLSLASGQYVLFLNSDDFLIGRSSVADAFAKISLGSMMPDMVLSDVIMGHLDKRGFWRMRRVPRLLSRFPRLGAHPPHQGSFIKRALLVRAGGFDPDLRLAADTTLFYRLVHELSATIAVSGTITTFMRMGGLSNNKLVSFRQGNAETYRYLRLHRSAASAALSLSIKIAQKLFEYRYGRLRREYLWNHAG